MVATEEKRSISPPENEPAIKGARDCFVENLLTNSSLVRRHIKAPELKIAQHIVGRQSLTPVDVLWVEGLTDPELVREVRHRISDMDIDALLSTGNLEEYLVDEVDTPFPMLGMTQRPDRFCHGLMEGRVGILLEGIPQGFLAPGTVGLCFETGQETPITILRAIQDIGTGNVGVNLDTANIILYGKANPVDAIKIIGDYVKCLHLKDGLWPTDGRSLGKMVQIGQGEVDFPAVVKGLHDHGYRGHFTIEREIQEGSERNKDIIDARDMIMDLTSKYEWDPE
jgi:hypothetical protein